jgi:transmembrane sensor
MLQQNEIEIIERYLNGISDSDDNVWIEDKFSFGKDDLQLRNHLERDWENTESKTTLSQEELSHLLDRVHHKIHTNAGQKRKTLYHRFQDTYTKAAAILLLPLIVAAGILFSLNYKTSLQDKLASSVIHAPLGSRVSFSLPDGTKGWLNSGSSLSYSLPFVNNRNVALQGEAWFDVTHDAERPFEIKTANSTVQVLGTSFYLSAYNNEHYVEVVLQNGKVKFTDNSNTKEVTLLPSERLVFRDGEVAVTAADPTKYKAWTEGKLVFRGDDMAEVARRIERWYNIKVELADKDLEQFSFRATFEDDSLEEVLQLLSMTSPIGYQIIPRKLNSDGTVEKERVILTKKFKQIHS